MYMYVLPWLQYSHTWQLGCVASVVVMVASGVAADRLSQTGANTARLRGAYQATGQPFY